MLAMKDVTSAFAPEIAAACPACGTMDECLGAFRKDGWTLARCGRCQFLFVSPYPSADDLRKFYNDAYRGASSIFYPKAESRMNRARVRALKFAPYLWQRDVLDLGCGGGFIVRAFSRWARSATGLDISQGGVDYARSHFPDCTFYCEDFAAFRTRGLRFGFVFASELLEHLPGTDEFMATLTAATEPGSYVYFSAPDIGHRAVPNDVREWGDICPPEHLQFFNRANAQLLFERYGFRLHKVWNNAKPAHSLIFVRL